jgi:hypothetical protein
MSIKLFNCLPLNLKHLYKNVKWLQLKLKEFLSHYSFYTLDEYSDYYGCLILFTRYYFRIITYCLSIFALLSLYIEFSISWTMISKGNRYRFTLYDRFEVFTAVTMKNPHQGVSTLTWWWGLCDSVTWRVMPAVV